jgi:3-deoxy-7-phosphoheptulonate synthase
MWTILDPDELIKIIDIINPSNEAGKISLIFRYGEENIDHIYLD